MNPFPGAYDDGGIPGAWPRPPGYGKPGYDIYGGARLPGGGSTDNFMIPGDKYQSSQSSGASGSRSAIDWDSPLGQTLLPLLQESAQSLPGLAGGLEHTIQGHYNSMMRKALQPQAFQGTLNQLVNRGVLNSSIAKDTLSDVGSQIARGVADKGYLSQLQGVQAQMQVPGILGQLAELNRVAEARAVSQSSSSDPLAPYELMARMMMY